MEWQRMLTFFLIPNARLFILSVLVLSAFVVPNNIYAQTDILHIPREQTIHGNVTTTTRSILIEGTVLGDVTSWSGDITILGYVRGDVVSYSGRIEVGAMGQVDGHILALAGGITRDVGAQITGQMIGNEMPGTGAVASLIDLFSATRTDATGWMTRIGVRLALAFILLLAVLVIRWRWPQRTDGTRYMLLFAPWRSIILGLLTTLLFVALLLPLSVLLAMTLIGLPMILIPGLLLQLPYVCGLTVLSYTLGKYLLRSVRSGSSNLATALGALTLLISVTTVSLITPAGGAILFYLVTSAGLGALILSRGGAFAPFPGRKLAD